MLWYLMTFCCFFPFFHNSTILEFKYFPFTWQILFYYIRVFFFHAKNIIFQFTCVFILWQFIFSIKASILLLIFFKRCVKPRHKISITVLYHFSWASYEAFQYVVRRWRQLFQTMKDFSKTVLWSARFLSMKTSIIDCLKCFCSIKYAASWAPISTWLKNWLPILLTCCRITNFATFWKFFFPSIFFFIM